MKNKTLYWIPRIITIFAILFMAMFSLDVFEGNQPLQKKLLGLLMHNIPALILTGILIIAWRWEKVGGALLIIGGCAGCVLFKVFSGNFGALIVMSPFFISGLLFILHDTLQKGKEAMTKV